MLFLVFCVCESMYHVFEPWGSAGITMASVIIIAPLTFSSSTSSFIWWTCPYEARQLRDTARYCQIFNAVKTDAICPSSCLITCLLQALWMNGATAGMVLLIRTHFSLRKSSRFTFEFMFLAYTLEDMFSVCMYNFLFILQSVFSV